MKSPAGLAVRPAPPHAALPSAAAVGRLRPVDRPLPALPLPPARSAPVTSPGQGAPLEVPAQPAAQPTQPETTPRAAVATVAEVTVRVQAWVATGTPRLGLELTGNWAGRVDLERTGRGRVRVRWQVRDARRMAGVARRLQQALGEAGLTVDGLSVVHGG